LSAGVLENGFSNAELGDQHVTILPSLPPRRVDLVIVERPLYHPMHDSRDLCLLVLSAPVSVHRKSAFEVAVEMLQSVEVDY
jgi:hypothetical protein